MNYVDFLKTKRIRMKRNGIKVRFMPDCLFPFQAELVEWAILTGRCALFEDCGLGKTIQQLVWLENMVRHYNRPGLILAPLAVVNQTIAEADKFGMKVRRIKDGKIRPGMNITNYQQLHKLDSAQVVAVVADEGSILKNFDGKTRRLATEFMVEVPHRLICTATPSPNDFVELGCHSEALGAMPRNQMLAMFFRHDEDQTQNWSLKGHARTRFWEWMGSWAKAIRRPSDMGYPDEGFALPELSINRIEIKSPNKHKGFFPFLSTLKDQRNEKSKSILARCEKAASLLPPKRPGVVWCQLNKEAETLLDLIPGSREVSGATSDEEQEELFEAFRTGQLKTLITKPQIASFGLNWQHCSDMVCFPSHSHEQFYQLVRRCWRFGQIRKVNCHLVYTDAERLVVSNMLRKERQNDELYTEIIRNMNPKIKPVQKNGTVSMEVPSWLR